MPTVELVKSAMETHPAEATEEMKEAMDVLLNMAIPAVEPAVLKRKLWINQDTTHRLFLGNSWASDFASALILLQCFSKKDQIYRNLGFWDKNNNPIPMDQRVKGGPENKERGKDLTKKTEETIGGQHSRHLMWLKQLFAEEAAQMRMDAWDMHCCSDRGKKRAGSNLVNTVPHRNSQQTLNDAGEDELLNFTQQLLDSSTFWNTEHVVGELTAV